MYASYSAVLSKHKLFFFIFIVMFLSISIPAQERRFAPPGVPLSPQEMEAAKKEVETFCASWKALNFDTMYQKLSVNGLGKMKKEEFIRIYEPASDRSGKLSSYSVVDAVGSEDGLLVKGELTFEKNKTPHLLDGIHNFHMVKEGDSWKIKTIVAPVAVPSIESGAGGSHPGE